MQTLLRQNIYEQQQTDIESISNTIETILNEEFPSLKNNSLLHSIVLFKLVKNM